MEIFRLLGKVVLNATEANRDLDQLGESGEGAADKIQGSFGKLESFARNWAVPALIAGGLAKIGKSALDNAVALGNTADRLLDLEQMTGLNVGTIQEFEAVSRNAGVSLESITGAASRLTLRLKGMDMEGGKAEEMLNSMGVSIRNANGDFKSMDDLLPDVIKRLQGIEDITQRNRAAAEIFGRSYTDLAPVLGMTADEFENVRQAARDSGEVMDRDALDAANNFRISMANLRTGIGLISRDLTMAAIPILNTLVDVTGNHLVPAIRSVTGWVTRATSIFERLPGPLQAVVVGVSGIATASVVALPLLSRMPGLFKAAAAGARLFSGAVTTAWRALMGPIGVAIALVGALYVAYQKNFLGIGDVVRKVVGYIGERFQFVADVWKTAIANLGTLQTAFREVFRGISEILQGYFKILYGYLVEPTAKIIQPIGQAIGSVVGIFTGFVNRMADTMQPVVDFLNRLGAGIGDGIRRIGSAAVDSISNLVTRGTQEVTASVAAMSEGTDAVAEGWQLILQGGERVANAVFDARTSIAASWADIRDRTDVAVDILESAGSAALGLADGFGELASQASGAAGSVGSSSGVVKTAATIMQELEEGLGRASRMHDATGDSTAYQATQVGLLRSALSDLIELGLDPTNEHVQEVVKQLEALRDVTAEAREELQKLYDEQFSRTQRYVQNIEMRVEYGAMGRQAAIEQLTEDLDRLESEARLLAVEPGGLDQLVAHNRRIEEVRSSLERLTQAEQEAAKQRPENIRSMEAQAEVEKEWLERQEQIQDAHRRAAELMEGQLSPIDRLIKYYEEQIETNQELETSYRPIIETLQNYQHNLEVAAKSMQAQVDAEAQWLAQQSAIEEAYQALSNHMTPPLTTAERLIESWEDQIRLNPILESSLRPVINALQNYEENLRVTTESTDRQAEAERDWLEEQEAVRSARQELGRILGRSITPLERYAQNLEEQIRLNPQLVDSLQPLVDAARNYQQELDGVAESTTRQSDAEQAWFDKQEAIQSARQAITDLFGPQVSASERLIAKLEEEIRLNADLEDSLRPLIDQIRNLAAERDNAAEAMNRQQEAEQKWLDQQAETERRVGNRLQYERQTGTISLQEYLSIIDQKIEGEEEYTDKWMALQEERRRVEREISDEIKKNLEDQAEVREKYIQDTLNSISGLVSKGKDMLGGMFGDEGGILSGLLSSEDLDNIEEGVNRLAEGLMRSDLPGIIQGAAQALVGFGPIIVEGLQSAIPGLEPVFDAIGGFFNKLGLDAKEALGTIVEGIAGVASNLASGNVLGAIAAGVGTIVSLFGQAARRAREAAEEARKAMERMVEGVRAAREEMSRWQRSASEMRIESDLAELEEAYEERLIAESDYQQQRADLLTEGAELRHKEEMAELAARQVAAVQAAREAGVPEAEITALLVASHEERAELRRKHEREINDIARESAEQQVGTHEWFANETRKASASLGQTLTSSLKSALQTRDWSGVGASLKEKFREYVLNRFVEMVAETVIVGAQLAEQFVLLQARVERAIETGDWSAVNEWLGVIERNIDSALEDIEGVFEGWSEDIPNAIDEFGDRVKQASDWMGGNITSALRKAVMDGDWEGAKNDLEQSFINYVFDTMQDMAMQTVFMSGIIAEKMAELQPLIQEALETGDWSAVKAAVNDVYADIEEIFDEVAGSLSEGMADVFVREAEDEFGVASASKVMHNLAKNVTQGFVNGIGEGEQDVVYAAASMVHGLVDELERLPEFAVDVSGQVTAGLAVGGSSAITDDIRRQLQGQAVVTPTVDFSRMGIDSDSVAKFAEEVRMVLGNDVPDSMDKLADELSRLESLAVVEFNGPITIRDDRDIRELTADIARQIINNRKGMS